jgi:hypothetical protein
MSKQPLVDAKDNQRINKGNSQTVSRTYEFAPDTVTTVEETAARLGVGRNELVHFCLRYALGEIVAGRLEVPTRPRHVRMRIILPPLGDGTDSG